jgi:hypothetical protein
MAAGEQAHQDVLDRLALPHHHAPDLVADPREILPELFARCTEFPQGCSKGTDRLLGPVCSCVNHPSNARRNPSEDGVNTGSRS